MPVAEMLGDTAYGEADTRVGVEAGRGAKVTAETQPPASTGRYDRTMREARRAGVLVELTRVYSNPA